MSTRQTFRLINDAVRERAQRWLRACPDGTIVETRDPTRSLEQNALLWARLNEIAKQVEWYGSYLNADDWKDILTASLRKARVVPGIDPGSCVALGLRTSKISVTEMTMLLDLIDAFAAERGVIFSDPECKTEQTGNSIRRVASPDVAGVPAPVAEAPRVHSPLPTLGAGATNHHRRAMT